MDLKKIFIKDACPTKMGGQAVMEGIMMKGEKKTALAVRLPNGNIEIETKKTPTYGKWMKVPLVRGVVAFVDSLVYGCKTLMDSANMLEEFDDEEYEQTKFEAWLEKKFGTEALWKFLIYSSVVIALAFSVGIFILLPTWVASLAKFVTTNVLWINFIEGLLRIALFVAYVWAISYMPDIKRVFRFHGAEHKTIHTFENLPRDEEGTTDISELTVEACREYPTLHPRCGTSFLMFVFIIAFACHVLLGWPVLWVRIVTRILLLPVVAGLSYELLKWAGRSDNWLVKILSMPGLWLQKITTAEPDDQMLEVAIVAVKAVCDETAPRKYIIRKLPEGAWPEDRFNYPNNWGN
ncbi:MAG: DUF1385 domain-containing protein [Bacillota bacterium]|nr:DUF1385 domain-containing protein [Bacillota bacterium]